MFSWDSKRKSSIQVWDDSFGNLVDIFSDPYDDDMFNKSFAHLSVIVCPDRENQGRTGRPDRLEKKETR